MEGNNSRETLTELGHNAFAWFWSWYLNMIKNYVFTETNVWYYAVACIFLIGLIWLTAVLFQDKDD